MADIEPMMPITGGPKKKVDAPKGPSKLFTDYYGSVFLLLIAAFLLAAFFVLKPELDDIKQTNAQTTSQIELINRQRNYLQSLQQSVAAAQTIPPTTLQQVDRALPDDPSIPSLLVQFGSAAASNNVRIDSMNFTEPTVATQPAATAKPGSANPVASNPQIRKIDISLAIHAYSYFDVKRFLSDLESSLRLLDVTGITASGAGGQVTYALTLRSYTFAPTAAK